MSIWKVAPVPVQKVIHLCEWFYTSDVIKAKVTWLGGIEFVKSCQQMGKLYGEGLKLVAQLYN